MGVELESQSFEYNDSDQNSPSFKSRNQKAKEYDNRDPKNVKKTEQYDSIVDLKKGYDAPVKDSHEPVSHSTKDIGSFMMFANDKELVKKPLSALISNPQQVDKFQNPVDVHVDRTVAELEPEMEVCYKENSFHVVKDICVDKGVFTKHKFMFEENVDGAAYNFFPLESFDDNQNPKDNTGIKVLNQPETDDSDEASSNHDQHNDVIHKDDGEIEDLVDNFTKAMDLPEDTQDSVSTGGKDGQVIKESKHFLRKHMSNVFLEITDQLLKISMLKKQIYLYITNLFVYNKSFETFIKGKNIVRLKCRVFVWKFVICLCVHKYDGK